MPLLVLFEKRVSRSSFKVNKHFFFKELIWNRIHVFFSIYRGRRFQYEVFDVTNVRTVFIGQSKGRVNLSQSIDGAVQFLKILTKSAKSCIWAEWIVNPCLAKMIDWRKCHILSYTWISILATNLNQLNKLRLISWKSNNQRFIFRDGMCSRCNEYIWLTGFQCRLNFK